MYYDEEERLKEQVAFFKSEFDKKKSENDNLNSRIDALHEKLNEAEKARQKLVKEINKLKSEIKFNSIAAEGISKKCTHPYKIKEIFLFNKIMFFCFQ